MFRQTAQSLVYNFLDEDDPAQYQRVQDRLQSGDYNHCLRVIVYNQPPFAFHRPHLDDWETMERYYSGSISFMLRAVIDRANISCVQEVGFPDNKDFYGAMIRNGADVAVGSIYFYPPNARQFRLFAPQFVWDAALVGRERFHQVDVTMSVLSFYTPHQWISIAVTQLMFCALVTWARSITHERLPLMDNLTRLVGAIFEYLCMHLSHVRVEFWPVTDHMGTLERLNWKRLTYAKLLLDLRLQILWIVYCWLMFNFGSNDLLGILMSPLASDRFTSLMDVIVRNSTDQKVIYWPGAALDQLLQQIHPNKSFASYILVESENNYNFYDLFDHIHTFESFAVTSVEICRSIVIGTLNAYSAEQDNAGLYYVIDRKSLSTPLGFIPFHVSDHIPKAWLSVYNHYSAQHDECGLFEFETNLARERLRRFVGASVSRIEEIDQNALYHLLEGASEESSFAPLGMLHLGSFFTLLTLGQLCLTFVLLTSLAVYRVFVKMTHKL